jgi:hypothetical protein
MSEQPLSPVTQQLDPAWGGTTRKEPRWPASLTVAATVLLYISLPNALTVGPTWLMPVLVSMLVIPLSLAAPHRYHGEPEWQGYVAIALIAIINLANVGSIVLLVHALLHGSELTGQVLLVDSLKIWLTNVLIFGLWYWELDRGGPDERTIPDHREPDFLFPQMSTPGCTKSYWSPGFIDYLYLALTNATAFSPTDTLPLTPMAKSLMGIQSLASLLTVALIASRAVNILH